MPINDPTMMFVICNTNVKHALGDGVAPLAPNPQQHLYSEYQHGPLLTARPPPARALPGAYNERVLACEAGVKVIAKS